MGTLNSACPSTSVILRLIWLCRNISHTNIAGFTFWLRESAFPAAWPGGLVRRQAYSKMINDHCGKRCLRRQSRGILDAEKKLEPSNAAMTEIVLVSF